MPRKNKAPRKLWIEIKFKKVRGGRPTGSEVERLRDELAESIIQGHYQYSKDWRVELLWRNKESDDMKSGEFTQEMRLSARSSTGFDYVVLGYLLRK